MRVIAQCVIDHNGELYEYGDEMLLTPDEAKALGSAVEIIDESESEIFPPEDDTPKRRGRQKKN